MSNEYSCADCEHLSPIITQTADYYCYKKSEYLNNCYRSSCEHFKLSKETLEEKQDKIW